MNLHDGNPASIGRLFGVPEAPWLMTVPVERAAFSVTRLRRDVLKDVSVAVSIPAQDAYFVMLYLKDVFHCDIGADGRRTDVRCYPSGTICLVDLTDGASIALHSSLDALAFVLPKALFAELNAISSSHLPSKLACKRGASDVVMRNLGAALLPLLDYAAISPSAALPHIAIAVCAHLLHAHAAEPTRMTTYDAALSVWKGRRDAWLH